MGFEKQFKDPIYGYIKINSDMASNIIDASAFQRLKDIRQTSYTPLFPGAYHNRFIHSLGVYHLGCIAFAAIKSTLEEQLTKIRSEWKIEKIQEIFELSCLLHDIGHAPFSHTGENFFLDEDNTLYTQLKECVNETNFSADFDALGTKKPAAHECMSCVVGLKSFPIYFKTCQERSLFARCIIGMTIRFTEKIPEATTDPEKRQKVSQEREATIFRKTETELLNCVISLLNSSIIDVDRLDYIIRDAATIGFKNAQVDYMRLLNGMRIVQYERTWCIGYHKSALSVIESAVYAHDAERKWVQGHPSILYEMEVLKYAMGKLTTLFATKDDPNPIFCYEALTENGKRLSLPIPLFSPDAQDLQKDNKLLTPAAQELLNQGKLFGEGVHFDAETGLLMQDYSISLLADEDVLYLMKRFCKKGFAFEYFTRNQRRIALWKSEAEFRTLFQKRIGDNSDVIKKLEEGLGRLVGFCQRKTGCPIVNRKVYDILDREQQEAETAKRTGELSEYDYSDIISGLQANQRWMATLERASTELSIEFDFLIISQKKFSSSFSQSIGNIPMFFPHIKNGVVPFSEIVDILKADANRKSNFFHLFYKPQGKIDQEKKTDIVDKIVELLIGAASGQ